MAGLGGNHPAFDRLLNSDQPKDTEVIIVEEDVSGAADQDDAGRKRGRPGTADRSITLEAHLVVLFSLSPYFEAKVTTASTPMPQLHTYWSSAASFFPASLKQHC